MSDFDSFVENLMKVILVPDESSDLPTDGCSGCKSGCKCNKLDGVGQHADNLLKYFSKGNEIIDTDSDIGETGEIGSEMQEDESNSNISVEKSDSGYDIKINNITINITEDDLKNLKNQLHSIISDEDEQSHEPEEGESEEHEASESPSQEEREHKIEVKGF